MFFGITVNVCEGEKPISIDSEVFDIRPSSGWKILSFFKLVKFL